ncbi:MAG TPA: PH domain-containing protein [Puia sp.]|nr:PH domain-containing protein [Puia sp.]
MKTFKTSLDINAYLITIGFAILFVMIIAVQFSHWESSGAVKYFLVVLLSLIYFMAYLYMPLDYKISNEELIIHRLVKSIHIPRNNIVSAESVDKEMISWSLRTMGVGGLFGYYGRFMNYRIGNMIWYATRKDRAVLIRTVNDEKIILTPDEPVRFLAALNSY